MGLLYTKLKVFHYKDKIDSLPESVKEILPPVQIRIKPTNVCAHDCWYCAYRVDNLQLGKDMVVRDFIPRDKMMEIIEDVVEMGVKGLTFSGGGDPFYYPYLLDTVKRLSQTPLKFASLTNGARLNGELAEVFASHGTWLRVSIDGWDDESYAQYRGVKLGEFTKVMSNLANFQKLGGKCYLGISLIVDQKNAPHVYDFIAKLSGIGVRSVKISPCIVSNDGSENNTYHQPIFGLVKEQAERALANFASKDFEIYDSYHQLDEKFEKDYQWCPYLQILPIIGADLNVYACQDKAYNLDSGVVGTIKDRRFRDFWFSGKNQFFKIDPSKVCGHHCVANSKNKLILEYLNADQGHLEFV